MIPFVNIPLYMVGFFLLLTLIASLICHGGPLVLALSSSAVVWLWLLCLGFGLFIFAIFIHFRLKINTYFEQINYLKYREKINRSQKLKEALYDATMISATGLFGSQSHSVLLERLVKKVEESIYVSFGFILMIYRNIILLKISWFVNICTCLTSILAMLINILYIIR